MTAIDDDDLFGGLPRFAPGEGGKEEGMERAFRAANEAWKRLMTELVIKVAMRQQYFTTDDVMAEYYAMDAPPVTHEPRAFGPIMLRAAKQGVCRKSSLPHVLSQQFSNHKRPIQVWESLIYKR